MGLNNLKFETEIFQQVSPFQLGGGITPVETKPDPAWITQVATQLGQLAAHVNQLTQTVAAQAFTRAAPQTGAEAVNTTDEIRKLNQRLDELETRLPKTKQAASS
jgi:outer membrane murein-binding lipoprotein Lpp